MIRSCWSDGLNHVGGVCQMNTAATLRRPPVAGQLGHLRPGHGERELAGLRSDPGQSRRESGGGAAELGCRVHAGPVIKGSGSGRPGADPRPGHAGQRGRRSATGQARVPRLAQPTSRRVAARPDQARRPHPELRLAFRMQAEAPEAVDLAAEYARDACSVWPRR